MNTGSEFQTYYDQKCTENLPLDLIEKYRFVKCLRCTEEVDTLLMQEKETGKKVVAKCYKKGSIFYEAGEPACLKEAGGTTILRFEGEYKNEDFRCVCREYIEGISLEQYILKTRITQNILTDIAIKLARAMQSLHGLEPPVIHRDIKPSNIIVKEDGDIALIDLGISRVFKENETADTTFWGTEEYAPPEQYGFQQTDVRSDIYSYGVVLTWMLTGNTALIENPATRLEKIACRCRRFSPEKRYQNDAALLKALCRTTEKYSQRIKKVFQGTLAVMVILTLFLLSGAVFFHETRKSKAVTFREPLIEEAVRTVLDRPKDIITYEDLEGITGIYIMGDKACSSLEEYYEASGKWYATAKEERVVGTVEDLADLKNMTNLQQLCITGNLIRNLSPLKDLKFIQILELGDNKIESIEPLTDMKVLSEVSLSTNDYKDIEPISTWPSIKVLSLSETSGYDGSPVGSLKNMTQLNIRCDTDAYQYLSGLHVGWLELGASGQTDLECIRDVAYVRDLYIRWSDIRDISALEGREDIVYLNMEGCIIDDLSPLFTMPNLASVVLSGAGADQIEELTSVYGEPKFEITYTY